MKKTSKPTTLKLKKESIAILDKSKLMQVSGGNAPGFININVNNDDTKVTLSMIVPPICQELNG